MFARLSLKEQHMLHLKRYRGFSITVKYYTEYQKIPEQVYKWERVGFTQSKIY